VYESSFFPTSSPTFVGGGVFDDGYSNRGEVESYCGFDLHFLYGQGWLAFFHAFFLPIWISSLEKVLFNSITHFFIGSLIWGIFSFFSSLYILVISPLSDV
jgi:type IV secretory pathway TrbL component